jgi:hypothetical protein
MTWDGQSKFTGGLYATTGTYYANSWNANNSSNTAVGTASFTPSTQNNYQGTFSYTVNGVGTVTKSVTRLTLTPINLTANYIGGQSGAYSNCTDTTANKGYQDFFTAQVTQSGNSITMTFAYPRAQTTLTCTLSGTAIQNGRSTVSRTRPTPARTAFKPRRRSRTSGRRHWASKVSSARLRSAAVAEKRRVSPGRSIRPVVV